MTDILSLEQLVHLSLGDPEAGAVNFNVLKTLLLQMLKAMNLYHYKPAMSDDDQRALKEALLRSNQQDFSALEHDDGDDHDNHNKGKTNQRRKRDRSSDRLNSLEEKVFRFESQLKALNEIPSNSELIDRAKQIPKQSSTESMKPTNHRQGPILEIWQYTQMEKRIESAENGITRLASLLQDLLSDMNEMKESNEAMRQTTDELKQQQDELRDLIDLLKNDWARKSDLEALEEKLRNLQSLFGSLFDRLNNMPTDGTNANPISLPDFTAFVTWDRLEDALRGIRESLERSANDAAAALASVRQPAHVVERHSQTSAKRKDSPLPSDNLAAILEQLGTLNNRHEQLRALVDALDKKKLNREEFEAFKTQQGDLLDRLASLERNLRDLRSQQRALDVPTAPPAAVREIIKEVPSQPGIDYSGDISDIRTAIQYLRDELDRLKELIQDLIKKGDLSAEDIHMLKKLVQQLDQTKADKIYVNNELDKKADKRDMEHRVLKKDFNTTCGELSQNINDCLQRFHIHDDTQKQDLSKINEDIDGKLDRTELDALRDYMDKQLKKLKKLAKEQQQSQQQHVHMMSEDEAAGLRKQLIRFHCISCDRPIDVQPHAQQPSLPVNQAMRPIQSPRPYTTYELDQIRQYHKSQQFTNEISGGGGGMTDVYATIRQCGGSHTTTLPFKRQVKAQTFLPEETMLTKNEVDIKGHDGVIYKGRIDGDKLPAVEQHKKTSMSFLAPPLPKSRLDSHPIPPIQPQPQAQQREPTINDSERSDGSPLFPNLQPALPHLKRVLTIERELFHESQSFQLPERKRTSLMQCMSDWNEMNLDDLYKQWKNSICQNRPCHHHHEQFSTEMNIDLNELKLNEEETCSRSSLKTDSIEQCTVSESESIIIDKVNEYLTSERLTEDEQLASDTNSQRSLFKLDKTTSIHSLPLSIIETSSDGFIIEQNLSKNRPHLGRHEHWLRDSMNAYPHPFDV